MILWFIVANILNALFHISLCHVYLSNILIEGFYEDPLEDNVEGLKYSDWNKSHAQISLNNSDIHLDIQTSGIILLQTHNEHMT